MINRQKGLLGWLGWFSEWQGRQLAAKRAIEMREEYERDDTSDAYDAGGLATAEDTAEFNLKTGEGVFVAIEAETGEALCYNGPGSMAVCGLPASGKGLLIQTNLGHLGNDWSIFDIDVNGEGMLASIEYRRDVLRQSIVLCDPYRVFPNETCINVDPIAHIRNAGLRGDFDAVQRYAAEFAHLLVPINPSAKDEDWVGDAARHDFETFLVEFAMNDPEHCTLPYLYDFLCLPPEEIVTQVCQRTNLMWVLKRMQRMKGDIETDALKQLHWKLEKMQGALASMERHTLLGRYLQGEPFDASIMKREPTTLYIVVPAGDITAAGPFLNLVISSLVGQLADAKGPQKILAIIDEASQLPKMPLLHWIQLLRKCNIRFWSFWQSLAGMEKKYSKEEARALLASCDLVQYLSTDDIELARRLAERAGTVTRFGRSMSRGGDGRTAQDSVSEHSRPTLPVPDILNLRRDQTLIELNGCKLIFALRYPWWELEPFCNRLRKFST